jgi:hypothetical protein
MSAVSLERPDLSDGADARCRKRNGRRRQQDFDDGDSSGYPTRVGMHLDLEERGSVPAISFEGTAKLSMIMDRSSG